jgi:dihydroorotase
MAAAGAVGFSDDGAAISNGVARQAFERAAALGLPILEHAEDPGVAAGGVMRAGWTATRLGLRPWPPRAETTLVERDLALARETGARLHLTHCSTAATLDAVTRARADGVAVTCDVTPHHAAMTDEWVAGSRRFAWEQQQAGADELAAYDGACRVNPPLASRADALALLAALEAGDVDAVATDHAPHAAQHKLVPFDEAAPGMIGLETALGLGLAAVDAGRLSLLALIAALATRPAGIIGEARALSVGAVADLVAFDPTATWRVERATLASRSSNTPLLGMDLPGVVRLTIADGRVTYRS